MKNKSILLIMVISIIVAVVCVMVMKLFGYDNTAAVAGGTAGGIAGGLGTNFLKKKQK